MEPTLPKVFKTIALNTRFFFWPHLQQQMSLHVHDLLVALQLGQPQVVHLHLQLHGLTVQLLKVVQRRRLLGNFL